MPGALFLEGERVNLRTVEEEDIEFLHQNINDPGIWTYLSVDRPVNLKEQKNFVENISEEEGTVFLGICVEKEIVGVISLEDEPERRVAKIGLWVSSDHHGNGYGTDAARIITDYGFNELNYHKIFARAYESNKGSQRIWEKLGFEREAKLREHVYRDGNFEDLIFFGILEEEWNE